MVPNNDKDRTYAVSYVPKVAGLHKVLRPISSVLWVLIGLSTPLPTTPAHQLTSDSDPQVTVLFAGQNIEHSPFEVNVGMALGDANKVSARGPGLDPVGNVANKPTYFDIYTAGKEVSQGGEVWGRPQEGAQ